MFRAGHPGTNEVSSRPKFFNVVTIANGFFDACMPLPKKNHQGMLSRPLSVFKIRDHKTLIITFEISLTFALVSRNKFDLSIDQKYMLTYKVF